MKTNIQLTLRIFLSIIFVATSLLSRAATPELKPELSPLAYFIGDWECSGKFDASGKSIDAHQHFEVDLDGAWITFRHDDKPPFNYHALSEWGWDKAQKKFVMIAQDSSGGARVFYSSGWESTQVLWEGGGLGSAATPGERFSFDRADDHHFKVSYFFLKNGAWSRMDSSTCTKS
jgi:hypothetical protein